MNDEVVERLETKVAFLERATSELSDVLYRQQLDIASLNDRLAVLSGRFDALKSEDRGFSAAEERPPHY
jgi:SlyX protein